MKKFKAHWEINHNWQLLFPFIGIISILYCSYKLASVFIDRNEPLSIIFLILLTLFFYYLLLKFFLFCFKRLENKWRVKYRWEMIRIFIVFAVTGSSSVFVSKPIMTLFGITKENLNIVVFWILYILLGLICYQILLITVAWLFGQYQFFKEFLKRFLKRIGLGILVR